MLLSCISVSLSLPLPLPHSLKAMKCSQVRIKKTQKNILSPQSLNLKLTTLDSQTGLCSFAQFLPRIPSSLASHLGAVISQAPCN